MSDYGSKKYTFDTQSEIDQLMRKISMDVSFIIRIINPSKVIFCQDDSSWRKDIKIDENDGYKGNRVKSKIVNWDNVYAVMDEFTDIVKQKGMIVSKISRAEADDIISLWSKEILINKEQNVIIVSGDEDIRQLVTSHKTKSNNQVFVTVFNPFMQGKNASRKLYVSKEFETWINTPDEVDFMNMSLTVNIDKEDFKRIIAHEKVKMEVVNGSIIGMRKIFCGDDGDNVPAFHTWLVKNKNGEDEEKRITNSKFEKIIEYISNKLNTNNINYNVLLNNVSLVEEAFTDVLKFKPTFNVEERLKRQIKLVILDSTFFPDNICKEFETIKNDYEITPKISLLSLKMQDLLEGTKYLDNMRSENESIIFKQIDRVQGHKNGLF